MKYILLILTGIFAGRTFLMEGTWLDLVLFIVCIITLFPFYYREYKKEVTTYEEKIKN